MMSCKVVKTVSAVGVGSVLHNTAIPILHLVDQLICLAFVLNDYFIYSTLKHPPSST